MWFSRNLGKLWTIVLYQYNCDLYIWWASRVSGRRSIAHVQSEWVAWVCPLTGSPAGTSNNASTSPLRWGTASHSGQSSNSWGLRDWHWYLKQQQTMATRQQPEGHRGSENHLLTQFMLLPSFIVTSRDCNHRSFQTQPCLNCVKMACVSQTCYSFLLHCCLEREWRWSIKKSSFKHTGEDGSVYACSHTHLNGHIEYPDRTSMSNKEQNADPSVDCSFCLTLYHCMQVVSHVHACVSND